MAAVTKAAPAKTPAKPAAKAAAPVAVDECGEKKPARPRADTLSQEQKDKEVNKLVAELGTTEDQGEKRKIRSRLRALGHAGGLGQRGAKKDKPAAKKPAKAAKPDVDCEEEAAECCEEEDCCE